MKNSWNQTYWENLNKDISWPSESVEVTEAPSEPFVQKPISPAMKGMFITWGIYILMVLGLISSGLIIRWWPTIVKWWPL